MLLYAAVLPGCRRPLAQLPTGQEQAIKLELVAAGITAPVAIVFPDDGTGRMFVVSQVGRIRVIDSAGTLQDEPLLDLGGKVVSLNPGYDERGLLGMALHPDFANNGRFFVYYVAPPRDDVDNAMSGVSVLSEFRMRDDGLADPDSERVLLEFGQPQSNHDGGQLAFGSDGYLYISTGDGGGVGDSGPGHAAGGNGQDKSTLLGKILRIGVDGAAPYEVPPDNPFVSEPGARPEIWAYGLRNPWRFSFDTDEQGQTRLFAGDVGQSIHEEIDLIERGGNYGWRIREGSTCFDPGAILSIPDDCPDVGADGKPLIGPIIEYTHATGTSVIGGVVYRGARLPELRGAYIFGDFSKTPGGGKPRFFAARENTDHTWTVSELTVTRDEDEPERMFLYAFGRDRDGEVYVLVNDIPRPIGEGGRVYRMASASTE